MGISAPNRVDEVGGEVISTSENGFIHSLHTQTSSSVKPKRNFSFRIRLIESSRLPVTFSSDQFDLHKRIADAARICFEN